MSRWYKGNLHSHTTNSDGMLSPEQAIEAYRNRGYSFLCLSDHNVYTDYRNEFPREDFLILPGVEASAVLVNDRGQPIRLHHMNGILGTQEMQETAKSGLFSHMEPVKEVIYHRSWQGKQAGEALARKLKEHGCIVTYNHPIWSRVEAKDFIDNPYIDLLEIYNYNTVNESGTGYDVTYWDLMLRRGRKINADAADDNHNGGLFDDAFGGFIMVKAESLTHDAIIRAILEGEYYSSSGPLIYCCEKTDGKIRIECSPVERIIIIVGGIVGAGVTFIAEDGKLISEAEYILTGEEQYVRVECCDQRGRMAWTNPMYF